MHEDNKGQQFDSVALVNSGLYTGNKGLGRQVHIHTEADPENAYSDHGVKSLCGKHLDADLTYDGRNPSVALLDWQERPHWNDPISANHDFTEATCSTCVTKAKKIRGF